VINIVEVVIVLTKLTEENVTLVVVETSCPIEILKSVPLCAMYTPVPELMVANVEVPGGPVGPGGPEILPTSIKPLTLLVPVLAV
jgi:hypothetical protein